MNKGTQTQVRVLAEAVSLNLFDRMAKGEPGDAQLGQIVAHLEVARQLALVCEELHRLNKKLDERGNE